MCSSLSIALTGWLSYVFICEQQYWLPRVMLHCLVACAGRKIILVRKI